MKMPYNRIRLKRHDQGQNTDQKPARGKGKTVRICRPDLPRATEQSDEIAPPASTPDSDAFR